MRYARQTDTVVAGAPCSSSCNSSGGCMDIRLENDLIRHVSCLQRPDVTHSWYMESAGPVTDPEAGGAVTLAIADDCWLFLWRILTVCVTLKPGYSLTQCPYLSASIWLCIGRCGFLKMSFWCLSRSFLRVNLCFMWLLWTDIVSPCGRVFIVSFLWMFFSKQMSVASKIDCTECKILGTVG